MKRSVFKIVIIAIIIAFLIVGAFVAMSIVNSQANVKWQARESLNNRCEKYAADFDKAFSDSEMLVKILAASISEEYDVSEYINDRAQFEVLFKTTEKVVGEAIKHSKHPIGIYVTYAPETCGGMDEIWYVKKRNGNIENIDSIGLSDSWLEESESTEYYFKTIREGSYWSEAGYDPGMDGRVISYTAPLRDKNGELIGVIGTDILVDNIFASLKEIEEEIQGHSAFIDKNAGTISGVDFSKYENTDEYIVAKADIGNRWQLELIQPIRIATGTVLATASGMIILGILILLAVIILIYRYSKLKVQPLVDEVELKDAMMVNQARQAKMGEMVGNIAHQWKQPLNGMKMSLSNMQDDYSEGMLSKEDFNNYVDRMKSMVDNLAETADDFTAFLKPGKNTEIFSANEEIKTILNLMQERIKLEGIEVRIHGIELMLEGYRNEFGQCMFNLIDNARDALLEMDEEKGCNADELVIDITMAEDMIIVHNNGKLINDADGEKIFDLYYSTKNDKEGTGIGLYLAREIIRNRFGGELRYENVKGGVDFIIEIPKRNLQMKGQLK